MLTKSGGPEVRVFDETVLIAVRAQLALLGFSTDACQTVMTLNNTADRATFIASVRPGAAEELVADATLEVEISGEDEAEQIITFDVTYRSQEAPSWPAQQRALQRRVEKEERAVRAQADWKQQKAAESTRTIRVFTELPEDMLDTKIGSEEWNKRMGIIVNLISTVVTSITPYVEYMSTVQSKGRDFGSALPELQTFVRFTQGHEEDVKKADWAPLKYLDLGWGRLIKSRVKAQYLPLLGATQPCCLRPESQCQAKGEGKERVQCTYADMLYQERREQREQQQRHSSEIGQGSGYFKRQREEAKSEAEQAKKTASASEVARRCERRRQSKKPCPRWATGTCLRAWDKCSGTHGQIEADTALVDCAAYRDGENFDSSRDPPYRCGFQVQGRTCPYRHDHDGATPAPLPPALPEPPPPHEVAATGSGSSEP